MNHRTLSNSVKPLCFFVISLFILISFSKQSYSKNIFVSKDSTEKEFTGQIESKKGKTIRVLINVSDVLPEVGTTGILAKYFEEEVLGYYTHGYINIAEVQVKAIGDGEATFTILKELTDIRINGKKENVFKPKLIVKFSW